MGKSIDLTGCKQPNGRLTATERVGTKKGNILWLCHCQCGNSTTLTTAAFRYGKTISCGCHRRNSSSLRVLKRTWGDNPPLTESQLRHAYVEMGLTTTQIAELANVSHTTVLNYLKKYQIRSRSPEEARKRSALWKLQAKKAIFACQQKHRYMLKTLPKYRRCHAKVARKNIVKAYRAWIAKSADRRAKLQAQQERERYREMTPQEIMDEMNRDILK